MTPIRLVHEVHYDERLIDLSIDLVGDDTAQCKMDSFWSNIYYAAIDYVTRAQLNSSELSLMDFTLIPSNYDIDAQTVSVAIVPAIGHEDSDNVYRGPVEHVVIGTDGFR